jgi:hypothetical protein
MTPKPPEFIIQTVFETIKYYMYQNEIKSIAERKIISKYAEDLVFTLQSEMEAMKERQSDINPAELNKDEIYNKYCRYLYPPFYIQRAILDAMKKTLDRTPILDEVFIEKLAELGDGIAFNIEMSMMTRKMGIKPWLEYEDKKKEDEISET